MYSTCIRWVRLEFLWPASQFSEFTASFANSFVNLRRPFTCCVRRHLFTCGGFRKEEEKCLVRKERREEASRGIFLSSGHADGWGTGPMGALASLVLSLAKTTALHRFLEFSTNVFAMKQMPQLWFVVHFSGDIVPHPWFQGGY